MPVLRSTVDTSIVTCVGVVSADFRVAYDPREVLARVVDGSRFGEYKPRYGTSLVTGWASVHGFPVGVLASARGVLFSEEARKAIEEQITRESHSFFISARLYDDGVIDPRDTRQVLGMALSAAHSAPVEGRRGYGVFRM